VDPFILPGLAGLVVAFTVYVWSTWLRRKDQRALSQEQLDLYEAEFWEAEHNRENASVVNRSVDGPTR
jgi:hypothetical protein